MSNVPCDLGTAVSDWVIDHPATLAVFKQLGIDYCCGGKSLEYACHRQGLDPGFMRHANPQGYGICSEPVDAGGQCGKIKDESFLSEDNLMAIPHAQAGEVVSVRPLGAALTVTTTHTIVKTDSLEVIRIVLAAGKRLPPHQVPGEITVQCIEGKVEFSVNEQQRELTAGTFLYVRGSGEHAVHAIEDSSLLVTIVLKHKI